MASSNLLQIDTDIMHFLVKLKFNRNDNEYQGCRSGVITQSISHGVESLDNDLLSIGLATLSIDENCDASTIQDQITGIENRQPSVPSFLGLSLHGGNSTNAAPKTVQKTCPDKISSLSMTHVNNLDMFVNKIYKNDIEKKKRSKEFISSFDSKEESRTCSRIHRKSALEAPAHKLSAEDSVNTNGTFTATSPARSTYVSNKEVKVVTVGGRSDMSATLATGSASMRSYHFHRFGGVKKKKKGSPTPRLETNLVDMAKEGVIILCVF